MRSDLIKLAAELPPGDENRRAILSALKQGFDWNDPEFVDAVEVLKPYEKAIANWLSRNTLISRWSAEGTRPSASLDGNGAAVSFSGKDTGGWWTVTVSVVGSRVFVEASPPSNQYPGWRDRKVSRGRVKDLDRLDRLLGLASAPLELIFRGRR